MEILKCQNLVPSKTSINACLLALGAPQSEAYNRNRKLKTIPNEHGTVIRRSLYNHLAPAELMDWASYLYRDSISKFHPDRHVDNKDFYEKKTLQINVAFARIKRILNFKLRR